MPRSRTFSRGLVFVPAAGLALALALALVVACGGPRKPVAPWTGVGADAGLPPQAPAPTTVDAGVRGATTAPPDPPVPPTTLDARACIAGIQPDEVVTLTVSYDGTAPKLTSCRKIRMLVPLESKAPPGRTFWEVTSASGAVTYRVTEARSPQCASVEAPPLGPGLDGGTQTWVATPATHRRPFAVMRVLPVTADTARAVLHDASCNGSTAPFAIVEFR